ncbi:MAG: transcriptional repressor [Candidatus Azobacteroides sp.]|nr:transcriptional repressor [Candidatus Azobacteroides sp.]
MNTKVDVKNRLLDFGVKPSVQRMAIMEYLMNNLIHPTADTIFNQLSPSLPTLSKTTVYNTLKLLEKRGAVIAIHIDEKNIRYDANISPHGHFKCKRCGCVSDFPVEGIESISMESPEGQLITECQLYFKGYCKECRKHINEFT